MESGQESHDRNWHSRLRRSSQTTEGGRLMNTVSLEEAQARLPDLITTSPPGRSW